MKSISQKLRMDGRDYASPGWYFVTMGADYHKQIFGEVIGQNMHANELGNLVEKFWDEIPEHYAHIRLAERQVMPNHFHGLVQIHQSGGKGLGEVMNVFKGAVTRKWRSRYSETERQKVRVWAPNYYDVICFHYDQLEVRSRYILANPRRWALRSVPEGTVKRSRYKGNVALIQQAHKGSLLALRVSRKAAAVQIEALQLELSAFDGTVCSTFFSPGERACLQVLQKGSAQIIWIMPMAMPSLIPEAWTNAFLEQRALWLSAFPDDQPEATRLNCEQANAWVQKFCEKQRLKGTD